MIYAYRCKKCGFEHSSTTRAPGYIGPCPQPGCDGDMHRRFSFSTNRPMEEHVNPTTMQPVRTMRQLEEQLKRKSDEATMRTGIEHRFVPHGPTEAPGVTGDGIDDSNRRRDKLGLPRLVEPK